MRMLLASLVVVVTLTPLAAQDRATISVQPSAPSGSYVTPGHLWFDTDDAVLKVLTAPDTWTTLSGSSEGGGIPAGSILFVDSGTCPTGFTEVSALNGRMVRGTVAANANVGGTGGADSVTPTIASLTAAAQAFTGSSATTSAVSAGTPAGTNSAPTFTGSALAAHAHELPFQIPSTTTTRQIAAATFGVGTSRAATAVSAAGTANTTSAAVALSEAKSAGTPAGTVSAPTFTGSALGTHTHTLTATGTNGTSAVTGTLNAIDNRAAYVNLIGCKKS